MIGPTATRVHVCHFISIAANHSMLISGGLRQVMHASAHLMSRGHTRARRPDRRLQSSTGAVFPDGPSVQLQATPLEFAVLSGRAHQGIGFAARLAYRQLDSSLPPQALVGVPCASQFARGNFF